MKYKDTELAYLAGFFDGEGSIMITKQHRNYGRCLYFAALITVGGTDKESIQFFADRWGGKPVLQKRTGNAKDFWQYRAYGERAEIFLIESIPYLRLKKRRAELALELIKLKKYQNAISDADYSRMVEIQKEIKVLNKRGK